MSVSEDKSQYDIGILGLWWGRNYGALFTSYALNRVLEKMGQRVALLDIAQRKEDKDPNSVFRYFLANEHISTIQTSRERAYELNKYFQGFVVGSDLVWNHDYLYQFFFLDFALGCKRKVAYSSSLSTYWKPREWYRQRISSLLRRFDGISFREENMLAYFREQFACEGSWVIDPVFLLEKEVWDTLAYKLHPHTQPHIAGYILDPTPQKEKLLTDASNKLGLPLNIILDTKKMSTPDAVVPNLPGIIKGASPYQWLHTLSSCELLITDSYHGLCFALIFNKPFICLKNTQRGAARFSSLLKLAGLEQHLTSETAETLEQANMQPIDWEKVNHRLRQRCNDAREWLYTALLAPRPRPLELYNHQTEHELVRKPSRLHEWWISLRIAARHIYHRCRKNK